MKKLFIGTVLLLKGLTLCNAMQLSNTGSENKCDAQEILKLIEEHHQLLTPKISIRRRLCRLVRTYVYSSRPSEDAFSSLEDQFNNVAVTPYKLKAKL